MRMLITWLVFIGGWCFLYWIIYDTFWYQSIQNINLGQSLQDIAEITKEEGVAFPDVYLAQVIHETNWLKSDVFHDHNNTSGMHCHLSWGTYCDCSGSNRREKDGTFCHYRNVRESVKEYKQWQEMRFSNYERVYGYLPKTDEEYIKFLMNFPIGDKKGFSYATMKGYDKAISKHLKFVRSGELYK